MRATTEQEDALKELVNIGYGRAAAALSEMTHARVSLEVPRLHVLEIDQVEAALRTLFPHQLTCVNQVFSGAIQGNALLMLDARAASILTGLIANEPAPSVLHGSVVETVSEVGNIVLNACLGVFGNLLQMQVMFTVPNLTVSTVEGLLRSLTIANRSLSHALLVQTRFSLRESNVKGYIAIILGITSYSQLLEKLDHLG